MEVAGDAGEAAAQTDGAGPAESRPGDEKASRHGSGGRIEPQDPLPEALYPVDAVRGAYAGPPSVRPRLRVEEITLRGFKSFREKMRLGPLAHSGFTCIVGSNGAGKSVIGDAIAFVLGSGGKGERLRDLVNQQLRAEHCLPAGERRAIAKVSMTLAVEYGQRQLVSGGTPSRLKLIREISASGSSTYYLKLGDCKRRRVSLTEFKVELHALGIPSDCRQRFIVMQNEQAVKVRDPLQLLKYLEVVMGLEGYSAEIERVEAELAQNHGERESLRQAQAQIEARRAQLQPSVRVWQQFVGDWEAFKQRKRRFLTRQATALEKALHRLAAESLAAKTKLAKQDIAVTHARRNLHEAEQKAAEGEARMEAAEAEQRTAEEKLQELCVLQARIKVRSEEARKQVTREEAARQRSAQRQKKRMEAAQQQVEEAEADLQALQGRRESAAKSLQSLQEQLKRLRQQRQEQGGEGEAGPDHGLLLQWVAAREAVHNAQKHLQEAQENEHQQQALLVASREERKNTEMALACIERKRSTVAAEAQRLRNVQLPQLHGQMETLKEEESALHELVGQCKELVELSSDPSATIGGMANLSALDRVVGELKQALSRQVLGRLSDLASVVSPSFEVPVNAVLSHSTNLATTLVVEHRNAAQAVVRRFEEDRLGLVTCDILSELQASTAALSGGGIRTAAGPALPCPLLQCLHFDPSLHALFSKYYGAWVVAESRDAAVRLLKAGRSCADGGPQGAQMPAPNIVTLNGELFKKDGEIVRSSVTTSAGGFGMGCWLRARRPKTQDQQSCGADEGQRRQQARKALESAQNSVKQLQGRARAAAQELVAAKARLAELQAQLRELDLSREAQQTAGASCDRLESQAGAARARVEACLRALLEAQERLKGMDAACNVGGPSDEALAEIVGSIVEKEGRLASLDGEMMRRTVLLDRLRKQLETQQSVSTEEQRSNRGRPKGKSITKRGVTLKGQAQSLCGESLVAEMERQAEVLALQCAEAEEHKVQKTLVMAAMRSARNELQAVAIRAKGALQKELTKQAELQAALGELMNEASQASSRLQRLQEGLAEEELLAHGGAPPGPGSSEGPAAAAEPPALAEGDQGVGGETRRRRDTAGGDTEMADAEASTGSRACSSQHAASKDGADTSADTDPSAEEFGSDEAHGGKERTRAKLFGSRRARQSAGPSERTAAAGLDDAEPDEDEGDTAESLASEEDALLERRRRLDMGAVEEDVECARRLSQAERNEQAAQAQWQELQVEKERLETARFMQFKDAADKVNDAVSRIYSRLTRDGDAYLSYTPEKTVLFSEGVQYNVRPDKHRWCPFHSLSGGQQAMACLALSFGLHSLYPSPFFFFDEFDAALDVHNVERVASYIKAHQQGQHIIISHRPQMYEKASAYIGVYQHNGTSTCVTAHLRSEGVSCDFRGPMEAEP